MLELLEFSGLEEVELFELELLVSEAVEVLELELLVSEAVELLELELLASEAVELFELELLVSEAVESFELELPDSPPLLLLAAVSELFVVLFGVSLFPDSLHAVTESAIAAQSRAAKIFFFMFFSHFHYNLRKDPL